MLRDLLGNDEGIGNDNALASKVSPAEKVSPSLTKWNSYPIIVEKKKRNSCWTG